MTLRCNACGGIVVIVADNGSTYPEMRVERYECEECGNEQTKVLTA